MNKNETWIQRNINHSFGYCLCEIRNALIWQNIVLIMSKDKPENLENQKESKEDGNIKEHKEEKKKGSKWKKITIINFWNKTKQSKKEIIIWAIITFLITSFLFHYALEPLFSYIDDFFRPKPNVVLYIQKMGKFENLDMGESSIILFSGCNIQNFYVLRRLKTPESYEGMMSMPLSYIGSDCYFNENEVCEFSVLEIINFGKEVARSATFDIEFMYDEYEITQKSAKIKVLTGTGFFGKPTIRLEIEDILVKDAPKEDVLRVVILTKPDSDIEITNCKVDENEKHCSYGINEMTPITPEWLISEFQGVKIPKTGSDPEMIAYILNVSSLEFNPIIMGGVQGAC